MGDRVKKIGATDDLQGGGGGKRQGEMAENAAVGSCPKRKRHLRWAQGKREGKNSPITEGRYRRGLMDKGGGEEGRDLLTAAPLRGSFSISSERGEREQESSLTRWGKKRGKRSRLTLRLYWGAEPSFFCLVCRVALGKGGRGE